jgi:hypothetical protein
MTVYRIDTIQRFVALEDERPDDMSGVPIGSRLLEADTATEFIYVGEYYASGVLTMAANAEVDDEISIGDATFVFIEDGEEVTPGTGDILIGASVAATVENIIAAVNGTDGVNEANADVTAAPGGAGEVVLTAIEFGDAANAITTVYTHDDGSENSFADATLTGGYDQWQALP